VERLLAKRIKISFLNCRHQDATSHVAFSANEERRSVTMIASFRRAHCTYNVPSGSLHVERHERDVNVNGVQCSVCSRILSVTVFIASTDRTTCKNAHKECAGVNILIRL
jgi:hypothetical protein